MWQALRAELHPQGLEVVTVALDTGGPAAARPWIEKAAARHPSLIDPAHVTDELLGFVNVPNAVWIDEAGMIVRPAHAAHVQASALADIEVTPEMGRLGEQITVAQRIAHTDHHSYLAALRDWVTNGADSPFALDPDEVVAHSGGRSDAQARAAACFELGQHLWRSAETNAAVGWFRQAHELDPDNWTYKRQAWTLSTTEPGQATDLLQDAGEVYGTSWAEEVARSGPERYYRLF